MYLPALFWDWAKCDWGCDPEKQPSLSGMEPGFWLALGLFPIALFAFGIDLFDHKVLGKHRGSSSCIFW